MNKFGLLAAVLGLVGVSTGAFGAHALRDALANRGTTGVWETAVFYQLVHAVALFALASRAAEGRVVPMPRQWGRAAMCWVVGVLLFSGSLYFLALGGPRWLGPVTPLGGVSLIAGWVFAGLGFWSNSSRL